MTSSDEIRTRFAGPGSGAPVYLPDLTLWYRWHTQRGTLPAQWQGHTLPQIAEALGVPAWTVTRPWRVELSGIQVDTQEAAGQRTVRYRTPAGSLTAAWSLGPDGDWWQTEYPIKTLEDLPAARELISARAYLLDPLNPPSSLSSPSPPSSLRSLELPMRPYSDLLHTLLGWGDGLMLLMGEGRAALVEMLGLLEEKLQALVEQVAGLPGDLALAPDNLDGQYISPRVFREQLAPSYRRTADALHAAGKSLVVHVGGPVKRLLPLLAAAGVDAVEGIAPAPQSDATLAEARTVAGPALTLWGGIPQDYLIAERTTEEFERAVAEAVAQAAGDPRMILGVADRVPVDADLGRLQTLVGLAART
jgi:hypothetical protein